MNTAAHRGLFVLAAVLVPLVVASAASRASAASPQPHPIPFRDASGDAARVPDIKSVSVSDSGGVVTFRFVVSDLMVTPGAIDDTWVVTDLDTNRDGKDDYYFYFGKDMGGHYWEVDHSSNGKPVHGSRTTSMHSSGDGYVVTIGSADIGNALGFDFRTSAATASKDGVHWVDEAPDSGWWSYELRSVAPVIGAPTATPRTPAAGQPFTLSFPLMRSDTGAAVESGATLTADPTVDGAAVRHTERLTNGKAVLRLTVPAGTTGHKLRVETKVTLGARSAHEVMTFRIG